MGGRPLEELDAVLSHISDSLFLLEQGFVHLKNTSHLSGCRVVQMRGFFQRETNIHLLRFCSLRRIFHTPQTHSRRGTLCSTQPPHAGTDAVFARRGGARCAAMSALGPRTVHTNGVCPCAALPVPAHTLRTGGVIGGSPLFGCVPGEGGGALRYNDLRAGTLQDTYTI